MWHVKSALPVKGAPLYIFLMFLDAFSVMLIAPIIPLFLRQFVANDAFVGYIFSFNAVVLIIATLLMDVVLKYIKKVRLLKLSLVVYFISFVFFPLVQNLVQLLILSGIRMFVATAITITLGLLVRDSVKKSGIGRTEGYYFMFLNVAALAGPVVGGQFAEVFGFNWTFLFAAVFPLLALLVLMWRNPYELAIPPSAQDHLVGNIREYFRERNLTIVYGMSIGLAFFWALIYTYLPLFLEGGGWGSSLIGYALASFVIPLLVLEVLVGKWVDQYGAKLFFVFGFIILGVFLAASYLQFTPVFLIAMLLIATIGAAFIEPVREAFLFKTIRIRDEVRFYTVYSTAFSVGSMLGPLLFSSILLVSDFKTMFLGAAVMMLVFALLAVLIKQRNHAYGKDLHHRAPGTEDVSMVSDRV